MANDVYHYWKEDLVFNDQGDLEVANATTTGVQRVLRRLLTNPGGYIWHPTYGAGMPRYVGEAVRSSEISSLVRSQILQEAAVSHLPEPVIEVIPEIDGFFCRIRYIDAVTGGPAVVSFNIAE